MASDLEQGIVPTEAGHNFEEVLLGFRDYAKAIGWDTKLRERLDEAETMLRRKLNDGVFLDAVIRNRPTNIISPEEVTTMINDMRRTAGTIDGIATRISPTGNSAT